MRVARSLAWIVLVVVGAVAAAGLVISLDHRPTDAARPELTALDASILAPRLAALDAPLGRLADTAQALSGAGRDVLVGLRALDLPGVAGALDAGDVALGRLTIAADDVRGAAAGLLAGLDGGAHLPAVDRERVVAITAAGDGSGAMASAWAAVAGAAVAPTALLRSLAAHEDAVEGAAAAGRAQHYPEAIAALDAAAVALTEATSIRDGAAAAGRDLVTLDPWLARLADHDTALRALYARLIASDGIRTAEVEAALSAVEATQAALPETRAALMGALMEVGGRDLTPSLLVIEDLRGTIEAALVPVDG